METEQSEAFEQALPEGERRHIAPDLHELTGKNLTALLMSLRRLRSLTPEKDQQRMALLPDCFSLVEKTNPQVRTLSYVRYPPLLDPAGLAAAGPWYTGGFAEPSGIRVELDRAEDFARLPSDVEMAPFSHPAGMLDQYPPPLAMFGRQNQLGSHRFPSAAEVADNGPGMPEHFRGLAANGKAALGVGIAGMRERVEQLGGQLEIASAPGKGTTVRVSPAAGGGTAASGNGS